MKGISGFMTLMARFWKQLPRGDIGSILWVLQKRVINNYINILSVVLVYL